MIGLAHIDAGCFWKWFLDPWQLDALRN